MNRLPPSIVDRLTALLRSGTGLSSAAQQCCITKASAAVYRCRYCPELIPEDRRKQLLRLYQLFKAFDGTRQEFHRLTKVSWYEVDCALALGSTQPWKLGEEQGPEPVIIEHEKFKVPPLAGESSKHDRVLVCSFKLVQPQFKPWRRRTA